jgi:glycosyltransferase involved in cell wall biosynthesis
VPDHNNNKILLIYYSSHSVCGIGTWLETLVPELEKLGWDVTVGLAWGNKFHDPERVEKLRPRLKFVRMDGRTGTEQGRVQAIRSAIESTQAGTVILNCLNSGFEAVRQERQAGRRLRLLATNHGNFPKQGACLLSHRDSIDLCVCLGRQSINAMTASPHAFHPDRIRHIANSVPTALSPDKASRPQTPFRIGFAARLDHEPRKRIADLILFANQLHERLTGCELWIAGDGSAEALVQEAAARNPQAIRYLGPLTRKELYNSFYPELDVFLNFSSNEAFGLSIAEAMAHGVVPVTSRFVGLESEGLVLEGKNALVFPVGDVNSAIEHVIALQQDSDLLSVLSQNARQHIAENFSPEQSALIWDRELKRVCTLPELPLVSEAPDGVQPGRFGLSERIWETLRRWTRRRVPHQSAGEEWPHYRCDDPVLIEHVTRHFEQMNVPAHVLPVVGATGVQ